MSEYERALQDWEDEGGNVPVETVSQVPETQEKEYDDVEDASQYAEVANG